MKILSSEVGFRYKSFEIEHENNLYHVIKTFAYPATLSTIHVVDQNNIKITDEDIINKIIEIIKD